MDEQYHKHVLTTILREYQDLDLDLELRVDWTWEINS